MPAAVGVRAEVGPAFDARLRCWAWAAAFAALPAQASDAPSLVDRLRVSAGPFATTSSLGIRVDVDPAALPESVGATPAGVRLAERGRTWRFDIAGTIDRRHGWRIGGFGVSGDARGEGSRVLVDDDREIRIDGAARGRLEIQAHAVSYAWWLLADDARALSVGLGLIRFALSTEVEARLAAEGVGEVSGRARYAQDALAPVVRVEALHRLSPRWRAGAELAWVRKPAGPLTGTAFDAALGVEWRPTPPLGFSLRYAWTELDLQYARRLGTANLGIRTHGPQLLASWQW